MTFEGAFSMKKRYLCRKVSDLVSECSTYKQEVESFERIVRGLRERMMTTAMGYLHDAEEAEDAVQETFLKVYRNLGSFRGECSEKNWIMKIAMRVCYDMNHSGWARFFNRRVTPDMLPDAAAAFEEKDDMLMNAVIRLPIRLREVILLYYYQGLKANEVAEALGISQPSVSQRLKRGREKLKDALEGRELDE